MLQGSISKLAVFLFVASILFAACRKREGFSLPDNYVIYTSDAQGISENENSIVIKLTLTRGTDKEVPISIKVSEQGAQYGTKYTTEPAATNGTIALVVPEGNNEVSFTVAKVPGALFEGTEKLVFDIHSSASPILIGNAKQLTLSFAELVATNSKYKVDGGGPTYPNKVFIDLSANRQTPVLRTNWDLGFSSDANEFRVILNSSSAMMAKPIAKDDLNAVTAADTVGFGAEMAFSGTAPNPATLSYIDYPSDRAKTAIAAIGATATDNKVYIINRGTGVGSPAPLRGWKKVRIIRNTNGGYTLQHADIAATSFSSIDIPKDDKYFFKYVSFETGLVNVEPEKKKWDIAWTYFTNIFGSGPSEAPFLFQDFVLQNKNVEVARVMTAVKTYETFAEADIAGQTFSSSQTTIGSSWRATFPAAAPNTDRYYIIKDGDGNYYKLRFTAVTDGGVRGYPWIEYALVKRG
jgi:hypothetical protein